MEDFYEVFSFRVVTLLLIVSNLTLSGDKNVNEQDICVVGCSGLGRQWGFGFSMLPFCVCGVSLLIRLCLRC
jgi:hypothetical protein